MFNGMRVIAVAVAVAAVAVVSISAFFYLTREIAAPSVDVEDTVQQLESSAEDGSTVVFRIAQDESQAQYVINEVLNGADKTVVGATSEVAGDILLNLADLSQSQLSQISINARTFATDNDRRDNSVARFVLQSETTTNEFITFQPTSITGLSATGNVGDTLSFQITGDLTIVGVTNAVTFETSATLESESRLVGSAEATVLYADFGLSIPNVPSVTGVEDNVVLKLDFVANACSPLAGAQVDVWHCDADGAYSGVEDPGFDTSDQKWLRGYQITEETGLTEFTTIYPGWYSSRAVHIHSFDL